MDNKTIIFKSLNHLNPRSIKYLTEKISILIEKKLWARVLAGLFLGLLFGLLISPTGILKDHLLPYSAFIETAVLWLALPAQFFMKLIQMVIIPLILASIIRGLASTQDVTQLKSLGIRFSLYVILSSSFAAFLGIVLSRIIKPGEGLNLIGASNIVTSKPTSFSFSNFSPETLTNILPSNPLVSIVEGQMLEVVVLAIIGGIALLSIEPKRSEVVIDSLEVVQSICMTIISWAMTLAPYAVFGLITQVTASTGLQTLRSMGYYVLTAFLGFFILILINILVVSFVKKLSPLRYLKKIATPMLLAFSTSSSAATMPVTMKTVEDDLNVDPSTARFLIPLGTTMNMAGSAIWHTTAILFLSQAYNVELSLGQIAFIVAASTSSAIGSPGVPGVGIGIVATIVAKIGIPIEGVSLILGVDRLIDMGCTVVNVTGDITVATLFGKNKTPI